MAASQRPAASDGGTNRSEDVAMSAAASAQCDEEAPDDDGSDVQADIRQAIATLLAVDEALNATNGLVLT